MKFKNGDHVRWLCPANYYCYGEVTIALDDKSKVLFDNEDWDYTYYMNGDLQLMTPEDIADDLLDC